ncbi:MAG TPA: hypothetical protein VGC93_10225 [Thermoanaerobaculia bacterium]
MSESSELALAVALGLTLIPLFWMGVVSLIARLGGWGALAAAYAAPGSTSAPGTPCWRGQSGTLSGYMNYNGVLRVCADPRGLGLSVMVLFRPGHAPLLIPWSEIAASHAAGFFGPWVELRFARAPRVVLRIRQGLAAAVAEASGGALRIAPTGADAV